MNVNKDNIVNVILKDIIGHQFQLNSCFRLKISATKCELQANMRYKLSEKAHLKIINYNLITS